MIFFIPDYVTSKSFHSLVPPVMFEDILPFFDLSVLPNVKELPRMLDAISPPIFIPGELIFGNASVDRVYVSNLNTQ